jgi:hypothetical protein
MSIESICKVIQESNIGMGLRESPVLWPCIEATHVLSLALSVGTIAIVDLRLIGWIMKDEPVTDVIEQTQPWTFLGFGLAFLSGALLFWSEAERVYPSWSFRVKMACIPLLGLNALIFHKTIYQSVDKWNRSPITPSRARFAGWFGLIFWAVVIFCGRWTAYNLQ